MLRPLGRCPAPLRWRIARTRGLCSLTRPCSPIDAAGRAVHGGQVSVPITTLRQRFHAETGVRFASWLRPHDISTIRSLHSSARQSQNAAAAVNDFDVEESHMSSEVSTKATGTREPLTKFSELAEHGLAHETMINTLTGKMKLETMTPVQSLTLNESLKKKDVLAQAKTGTGKTIAFLIPVIQSILESAPELGIFRQSKRRRQSPMDTGSMDIRSIIISPTRELAEQIAEEAKKLTRDMDIVVQTAVGGTQKTQHLRAMRQFGCHILVGTPGRLKDILSDRSAFISAPNLQSFVLDEADRLLDQGFWPEIQAIQDLLPRTAEVDRQTLMFSATVPPEVVRLARTTMKPDLHYVQTVNENEVPTHERVKQMLAVVPSFENQLPAVLELIDREIQAADKRSVDAQGKKTVTKPFKAIVYCNAVAETHAVAKILIEHRLSEVREPDNTIFGPTRIYEIQSRLTQAQRTAAADYFRAAQTAILVSSDVTARGMDFPNVTHVIQIGLPTERNAYIHRLGRTARAGAEGQGWLILPAPTLNEARMRLGKLPLVRDTSLETVSVDYAAVPSGQEPEMSAKAKKYFDLVRNAAKRADRYGSSGFDSMYIALLGVHQWFKDKWKLIEMMNRLSLVQWGMQTPPTVSTSLATKMGIRNVPGLMISDAYHQPRASKAGDRGRPSDHQRDRGSRTAFDDNSRGDRRPYRSYGNDEPGFNGRSRFEGRPPPSRDQAWKRDGRSGNGPAKRHWSDGLQEQRGW